MQPARGRTPVRKYPGLFSHQSRGKKLYGFVVDGEPVNGKRKQITRMGFPSMEAALKERTALQHRKNTGDVVEPSRELVADFFARWLEMRKATVQEQTYRCYEADFARIKPHIGHLMLREVRPDHVQGAVAAMMDAGYGAVSTRKAIDIARRVFTAAVRWGLLLRSPATHVDLPRIERKDVEILTAEQLRALVTANKDDAEWGLVWRVLVETWMRRSELLDLRWSSVDVAGCSLRVERALTRTRGGFVSGTGKTAAARRTIYISEQLAEQLKQYKDQQRFQLRAWGCELTEDTPVFCNDRAGHRGPWLLDTALDKACEKAGIPVVSPHRIRHSGISVARMLGEDFVTVSERAGHTDPKTTLIYSHTDRKTHKQLGDDFGAMLDEAI